MRVSPFARVANQRVRAATLNAARALDHVACLPLVDIVFPNIHVVVTRVKVSIESTTRQDDPGATGFTPPVGSDAIKIVLG